MITLPQVPLDNGQPVLLARRDDDAYQTWITGRDGDLIWVSARPDDETTLPPAAGAEVLLHTWRWGDALYTLRARVVAERPVLGTAIGLRLLAGARIQRREYFRVPVGRAADEAWVLPERGPDRKLKLHLDDISAGGLRATVASDRDAPDAAPLVVGDGVRLHVTLPGVPGPLRLDGRVVRVARQRGSKGVDWECGLTFTELAPAVREHMVRFALNVQRDQRRRGII
jgi:hypothetical protein